MAFVDLEKAYDVVPRVELIGHKLKSYTLVLYWFHK